MKPQEILDELDRRGLTVYWQQLGTEPDVNTLLRYGPDPDLVPGWLREEIRRQTPELLKIMRWEPGAAAGLRRRKPKSGGVDAP